MVEVILDACSMYYLDSLKHHAMQSSAWHMRYPNNNPDKHLKMDIIENEVKEPLLAGLAMGLLIQLYSKRQDLFVPDVSYCGIGLKDKHRRDNPHIDHVNEPDFIKIFGVISSDWGSMDGTKYILSVFCAFQSSFGAKKSIGVTWNPSGGLCTPLLTYGTLY